MGSEPMGVAKKGSKEAAQAPPPRKLMVQAVLGFVGVFGVMLALGAFARAPLERFGHWFVGRFGLVGMGIGTLLADGFHIPPPPQFYLLAAITDPGPDTGALIVVPAASVVAGMVAYGMGRLLANVAFVRRFIERTRERVDPLFERYGLWAVVIAAVTPVPYSFFCYLLGAYRMPRWLMGVVLALRVPRLLAMYAMMRLGWGVG